MGRIDIVTYTVLYCCLLNQVISGPVLNENADRSLITSGNSLEQRKIVLSSPCRCIELEEDCKVPLEKSGQVNGDCLKNQRHCCDDGVKDKEHPPQTFDKKVDNTSSTETNQTGQIQPLIRIRIRLASEDKSIEELKSKIVYITPFNSTNNVTKPQIKCHCKSRDDCEDKYTDYSFGFECAHDRVHCCEPQDVIQKQINEKIGLITTAEQKINDQSPDNSLTQPDYQCQCTNGSECFRLGLEIVKDARDDLCPFELVKCCGVLIMKKSDINSEDESPWNTSLEEEEFEGRGMGINVHGQPAFRQPIQLPVSKIPMNDTQNSPSSNVVKPPAEIILSPPELPTRYDNIHSSVIQSPSNFYRQGPNRPPIHQYYGGVGPYFQQNPPPEPYRTISANRPTIVVASERSRQSESILDKISNFFFG